MKGKLNRSIVLAATLLLAGTAALAGHATWQAKEGDRHDLRGIHAVFVDEDGAETFDLSELSDGEVRIFGSGPKQVTVERRGDEVTIRRENDGERETRAITCRVDRDTCQVLTFEDDPEKIMVMIEKRRECVSGIGDCGLDVDVAEGDAETVHVLLGEHLECAAEEDCTKIVNVELGEAPVGHRMVVVEGEGGEHGNFVLHGGELHGIGEHGSDRALLSCPEGDATLWVAEEEAEDTFLCPKHSVPLERKARRTIRVIREDSADDD